MNGIKSSFLVLIFWFISRFKKKKKSLFTHSRLWNLRVNPKALESVSQTENGSPHASKKEGVFSVRVSETISGYLFCLYFEFVLSELKKIVTWNADKTYSCLQVCRTSKKKKMEYCHVTLFWESHFVDTW